jgi:GH24 family phage-related lysozyme (muramidase)
MASLVSKQCVNFVKGFEGFYSKPYYDCVGVKTLGYGMTGSEIAGIDYVTEEQASQMLENLLNNKYAQPIKDDLDSRGVKLTQNQFDALVSMAYNVGTGGVLGSTLYRNICNGVRDVDTITADFCMWDKGGGQVISGLLRRRKAEAAMFFDNNNDKVEEEKKVENLVIYNYGTDMHSAEILADYLSCPTISNGRKFDYTCVKNIYAVGGKKEQYTTYLTKLIAGADRYATDQAVLDFIKNGGK